MADEFTCWGQQGGACNMVHHSLHEASCCLAEAIYATRYGTGTVRDRRVWRLVDGQRRHLSAAESDASYQVWSSSCVGSPSHRGSRRKAEA